MNLNSNRWKALIVDDEAESLRLLGYIFKDDFELSFAQNGLIALEKAKQIQPDVIILDIVMLEMDGFEVCKRLKSVKETAKIPVIFITGAADVNTEKKAFEMGGAEFITKPINPTLVKTRVNNVLKVHNQKKAWEMEIRKKTRELREVQKAAVSMLGIAGHVNDGSMNKHIWRMAHYSALLAMEAGWAKKDIQYMKLAASMHDTGKIGISDNILKKPGKLNEEEQRFMQAHTQIGYDILSQSQTPLFKMAAEIALYHHERWNGTGYPTGISGEEIPESARIVAITDVFDALTVKRPYKEEWTSDRSFEEIKKMSGTYFDPRLVDLFLSIKPKILQGMEKYGRL
ncbi:response regulator [Oceanispirochaeta crateris]|uniref:Response regulator n=1 Tax=Oceanispirochaeta crateris TaxID=2518645 RepID=A0A5C1QNZ3_9SPIO|nr:HD domain-containing phosphohydrolase [Oceanispirochaeta crateris]QEN08286.1 response regulator [Oceanispirochaeta crateris]